MPNKIEELTIGSTAGGIIGGETRNDLRRDRARHGEAMTKVRRAWSMPEVIACRPLIRTKQAENSSDAPITGRGIRISVPVIEGEKQARSDAADGETDRPVLTAVTDCGPMLAVDGVSPSKPTGGNILPRPFASVPRLIEPKSGLTPAGVVEPLASGDVAARLEDVGMRRDEERRDHRRRQRPARICEQRQSQERRSRQHREGSHEQQSRYHSRNVADR